MKVNDILKIAQGRVIAWDGLTGEQLFDSFRNNLNHIWQYGEGNVTSIWPGLKQDRSNFPLDGRNVPVIGMYVAHNSWEDGENE